MLNKLGAFIRQQNMIADGDTVICALSGGADSVALLFGLYLLRDVMPFTLRAAHFNHRLRGAESDRDEAFVRELCSSYGIPLDVGSAEILPGKKGLEAAARDARYAFFRTLPGKIATAHTADDNAETVLMHLLRGTGLRGLGGITPVQPGLIRPMLTVTRREVEAFLEEFALPHIEDSSNGGEAFLRNRIRHSVMPFLKAENPRFSENITAMALNLRQEEEYLAGSTAGEIPSVSVLRTLHPALRRRYLERFLRENGVKEPEQTHLRGVEGLVFSDNPSAGTNLPGGVVLMREYDRLVRRTGSAELPETVLTVPGSVELAEAGIRVCCEFAEIGCNTVDAFTAVPSGKITLRSRQPGDILKTRGGTKKLKKWFIDEKIPAAKRGLVPVIADEAGILGVQGIGRSLDRDALGENAVLIRFEKL